MLLADQPIDLSGPTRAIPSSHPASPAWTSPPLGAVLMSLSTVIVAINARLLRVKRD